MTQPPADLHGWILPDYLDISDKLAEGEYFLNLMAGTTDWNQFRWLTSAFLNAARASLDWLGMSVQYAIPGEGQYEMERDERAFAKLSEYVSIKHEKRGGKVYVSPLHPLLVELCKHRTETAHNGPLWIRPKQVTRPGEFVMGETSVLEFGRNVLALLNTIQREVRADID